MKLIESKAEYIPQEEGLEGIYKQVELAGRTCYKSEDKMVNVVRIDYATLPKGISIKDIPSYKDNQQQCIEYLCSHSIKYQIINSTKDFVDRMVKSQHTAMLEHGTIYLEIPYKVKEDVWVKYARNPYSKVFSKYSHTEGNPHNEFYFFNRYITSNFRVLIENNWLDDLQYLCNSTELHEKRYTLKFVTDRGVSHELVRHRVFSFAQESQRYCNYSKEKYGSEITFIKPTWYDGNKTTMFEEPKTTLEAKMFSQDTKSYLFEKSIMFAEATYFTLLKEGCKPQQARAVLPNATKTEIVMTGFASDWRFLMDLRLFEKTGAVHPDMKDLMQKVQKAMQKAGIWEDIMKYPSKFKEDDNTKDI